MANNALQQKLIDLQRRLPEVIKRLPGVAKVEGLKFIADNFKHEGFEEKPGQYKSWPKRKGEKKKKKLIGEKRGGGLKRSWQQDSKAEGNKAEFVSAKPYAEVHNDGLQAGKPPGFKMDQSEMIGPSEALDKRIEDKFDRMVEDFFK